ncbi:MAG TPA: hypothetical protein PKM41_11280 [Deltaproteobacteria bacterium]|jgi:tRNA(Ile2) C34 agmatinyltransferase TiaS|nr:hypothetical protein [Deltaproteobacteria bacterium]HOI08439.1 hypothetical protein [Deltaproteobacteria bacterium]
MRIFIGFDDTDSKESEYGTGKVARWFERELPEGSTLWGVVRQQLLVDDRIPYTSHNSSACAVVETADEGVLRRLIDLAAAHIERHAADGSDPGLCVCLERDGNLAGLMSFSVRCTREVVTQKDAMEAARAFHLSAHGGTGDGIIGAAAAVGLTAMGRCGRFIEYGRLRDMPDPVTVSRLDSMGIMVVSVDRQAPLPSGDDLVHTQGWLRPRLWAGRPILPVEKGGQGSWTCIGRKKTKEK